jgi:transposase
METQAPRKPYPSDVSDEEWPFVAPYLTLMREDAPQRVYPLREVFNGLRWLVRAGAGWRLLPHDLPPWYVVYQQTQRRLAAGVFETIIHDLRVILRLAEGRAPEPTAAIFDSRAVHCTLESGERRLRRRHAQARDDAAYGGGHARPPAGAAGAPGR